MSATTKEIKLIDINKIGHYDIICGRSRDAYNNVGNRRFRITIQMFLQRYQELKNRAERKQFITYLTKLFRTELHFRFLKKTEYGYFDVGEVEARKKIGHALLDRNMKRRHASNPLKSRVNQNNALSQSPQEAETPQTVHSLTRQVSHESLNSLSTQKARRNGRRVTELESDVCKLLLDLHQGTTIAKIPAVHSSESRRVGPTVISH